MVPPRPGRLTCFRQTKDQRQLEAACDQVGLALGCGWLRRSDVPATLPFGRPEDDIKLLFPLQSLLDRYHPGDELCLGNPRYPSMASRVQRFSEGILSCFAKPDNLALEVPREETRAFDVAEQYTRNEQIEGWPAVSRYGTVRVGAQRSLGARTGTLFLSWSATGRDSMLEVVRAAADTAGEFSAPLMAWTQPGHVVDAAVTNDGWRIRVDTPADDGSRHLDDISVACPGDSLPDCTRTLVGSTSWHGEGELLASGAGFVVAHKTELQLYPTLAALATGRPSQQGPSQFSVGEPLEVVAPDPAGALAMTSLRADGLYMVDVYRWGGHDVVSLPFPQQEGMRIETLARDEQRLLVYFEKRHTVGWEAGMLWDCPASVLSAAPPRTVTCRAFEAPSQMQDRLQLLTRADDSYERSRIERLPGSDLIAVHSSGWLWLLDPANQRNLLLPAEGVARLDSDRVVTYRAGRLDAMRLDWLGSPAKKVTFQTR